MKLIKQGKENCVMRAISTACAVLGLPQPTMPEPVLFHGNEWVTFQLARCFPNHEILVWCEPNTAHLNPHIRWMGTEFYDSDDPRTVIDDADYLIMYAYSTSGIEVAHAVIGYPPFNYPNHFLRFVAALGLQEAGQ